MSFSAAPSRGSGDRKYRRGGVLDHPEDVHRIRIVYPPVMGNFLHGGAGRAAQPPVQAGMAVGISKSAGAVMIAGGHVFPVARTGCQADAYFGDQPAVV